MAINEKRSRWFRALSKSLLLSLWPLFAWSAPQIAYISPAESTAGQAIWVEVIVDETINSALTVTAGDTQCEFTPPERGCILTPTGIGNHLVQATYQDNDSGAEIRSPFKSHTVFARSAPFRYSTTPTDPRPIQEGHGLLNVLQWPKQPQLVDIDADGRFVVYVSAHENQQHHEQLPEKNDSLVYLYDSEYRSTKKIVLPPGSDGYEAPASFPKLSGNGKYVFFASRDRDGLFSFHRHDILSGDFRLVTSGPLGSFRYSTIYGASVSSNGRFVAISGELAESGMAYRFGRDTIVWDLDTGAIGFETPDGHVAGIGDATAVRFSKDADFLVYSQNSRTQIRNRMSGLVEMVGIDTSGEIVDSSDPDVSADGRYVVFREYDFSLVHPHKIMVRDRALAQTQFVAADDALAGTDPYARPRISSDGQTVYFLSRYPLIPPGGNGFIALYARDLKDAEIELLSVNPYGMPTIGDTIDFAISENARIAFASLAPDQVAGFEGSGLNIFLIDRIANTKEVISGVTHAGQTGYDLELGGFATNTKEVSAKSRARMVGDQDANVVRDTYVLSVNSPPELVSKSYIDGTAAGGFSSDISSDGRFVAFGSIGEDITNDDVEAFWGQIYLMDRHTGDVELVSYDHDFPSQGANQWTSTASISPDGRFVGFKTDASNLTEHPIFSQTACLVRDTHTGEIFEQLGAADPWQVSECHGNKLTNSGLFSTIEGQRQLFFQDITLDQYWHLGNEPPGSWGDSYTGEAHATPDGELVVFRSNIDDLVENDLNGFSDIFLWFRDTDEFTRLSTGVGETEPNGHSAAPDISDDGRFVVYESLASNLVSRDRNNASDVFLLDRATGMTERLSLTNQSQELAAGSFGPRITGDGKFVVFSTSARSVGPGVSNHATDIFIVPNLNLYHEPNARDDIFPVTIGQQFSDNVISPESGTPDFVYRGGQLSVIEINGNPNIVGQPVELTSGTITLHVDGSFSYASTRAPVMPIENEDTFTYTVEDSMGSTSSALVTIYLTQSNAMPVATDDNLSSILEDQQIAIPSESLLDNDHAGEVDDEVIISDVWPITGGEPILVANGVVFKPVDNFNGPAEFGYSIQDQAAQENSAVVRFDVIPVNDPPLIHAADQVFATGIVQSIVDQSWLSLSKPGPANEDDSQEITGYQLLSTDDPDGILQSLDISTEGHLSYQTTGNGGAAVAWFVAMDDGGSLDGGVDQTEPVAVELYAVPGDDLAITASVVDNTVEPFQVAELLIEVNRANGGSLYGTWVEVVADGIPGTYSATSCASYSVVCYETETGFVIANTNFETTETVQYLQAEPSVVGERIPISVTVGVPYGSVDQNLQNNVVEIPLQLGIFVDGFE